MRILMILLFLSLPAAAQEGTLRGVGVQTNGYHWAMRVDFQGGEARVSYPQLGCSGIWTLPKEVPGAVEYVEQITQGADVCVPLGRVLLSTAPDGMLEAAYLSRSGGIYARAVLVRQTGRSYGDLLRLTVESADLGFLGGGPP